MARCGHLDRDVTILQVNVVRSVQAVADWHGREVKIATALPEGERTAVILQASDGRILGAALLDG